MLLLSAAHLEPAMIKTDEASVRGIIQAVNHASTKKGAVAARKLPSGDTVITFQGMTTRDWHSTNSVCIKDAFGQQAEESERIFAVLLKGPGAVFQLLEMGDTTVPTMRQRRLMETAAGMEKPNAQLTATKPSSDAQPAEGDTRHGRRTAITDTTNTAATAAVDPSNFTQGEGDDGYREASRKMIKGRPTSVVSAQHHALRDPQQTRINFESATSRLATLVPTTAAEPTATTTSMDVNMSDTVMEAIIVADQNES
ncbi:hypothetical protein B0H66DRAFT_576649 [Apodospora peruviana]|uniref:Uncharacterized protein n=1 Tax=Apodospora peruviana TaxID=516989 RepID=A0AAE0I1X2_9PEZI|nr:hypothetical protein B0H66DRAFT_576649 [Apodospora peruviana]